MSNSVIGIDISHDTLKVASLIHSGNKFRLQGMGSAPIPPGSWSTDELKNQEELVSALKGAMRNAKPSTISGKRAMIAFPESVIFSTTFSMPQLNEKEMKQAAPFEIAEKLSVNVDEYFIDYEVADSSCKPVIPPLSEAKKESAVSTSAKEPPSKEAAEPQLTVFAVAAKKTLVESVVEFCDQVNLEIAGIDIKPGAIVRSVVPREDHVARIVVDIGASATGVTVAEGKSLRLTTTVPIGAEQIFGTKNSSQSTEAIRQKASPVFDELVHVTKYFENRVCPNVRIQEILLTGGGSNNEEIISIFREETGLATTQGNPAASIDLHRFPLPQDLAASYAEAFGLAMRNPHKL